MLELYDVRGLVAAIRYGANEAAVVSVAKRRTAMDLQARFRGATETTPSCRL